MIPVFCLLLLLLTSLASTFSYKKASVKSIFHTQVIMITLIIITTVAACYQQDRIPYEWTFLTFDHIKLIIAIQWDKLAKIMTIFILVIGFFIYRYAQNYLESDQTHSRFLSQFNLVLCSVLLLVMSANLLSAFVAWQFIGINLYLLLNHYHYDPAANRAAKKKFVVNRVGDCSFLLAIVLLYHTNGSTDFASIHLSPDAEMICILIFISVMTKCAQFPFHIWLIDTMETPTPVSALMHAGVINAGGILLTRISQTLTLFHGLAYFILLNGLISAALSVQWMNQQPDIKKKLAYSTMGQMGYMLTQCSLGAFPAAIFHLISHGFYKASLFLNAGESLSALERNSAESVGDYNSIFKSYLITSVIFFTGLFLFDKHSVHIPLLMYGFIFLSLTTLVFKLNKLDQSNWKKRAPFYLIISVMFFTYLYIFQQFSVMLSEYEYQGTIPLLAQRIILIGLIGFQIQSWIIPQKSKLLVNQDRTEAFFRRCLLNPLRSIGDLINNKKNQKFFLIIYIVTMGVMLILFFYGFLSHTGIIKQHNKGNDNWPIFISLVTGIGSLIIANRCLSIKSLLIYLLLFEIAFTNLTWFHGDKQMFKIGLFHLINISTIVFMLVRLAKKNSSEQANIYSNKTKQSSRVFYLTVGLLLLIGIPGTASFISEFYLLNALVKNNLFFVAMYITSIILIAIVIMHSLQLYVFNKNYMGLLSAPLNKREHWFFLTAIGLNIFSGLHPSFLLNFF